jgi:exonuclease VII large subunit
MATTTKAQLDDLEKKIDLHMNHAVVAESRMHRIEDKLTQLAEAVISIARAEEKIAILMQDTKDMKAAMTDTVQRVHRNELSAQANTNDLRVLNRFFWLIASTSITLAGTAILMAINVL